MNTRIVLATLALLTTMSFTYGADPFEGVAGKYQAKDASNDWHYVTIRRSEGKEAGPWRWENKAGQKWSCTEGREANPGKPTVFYLTFADGPYKDKNVRLDIIRDKSGKVTELKEVSGGTATWLRK